MCDLRNSRDLMQSMFCNNPKSYLQDMALCECVASPMTEVSLRMSVIFIFNVIVIVFCYPRNVLF